MLRPIEVKVEMWNFLVEYAKIPMNSHLKCGIYFHKSIQQKITKLITIYIMSSSVDPRDISRSKKYRSVKDYVLKPVTRPALEKIFETGSVSGDHI